MANGFVPDPILLIGEGEARERAGQEVGIGAGQKVKRAAANPKLNVAKAKQRSIGVG